MSTPLSEQDLIQLNAYLDDELSAREREAFEQRLSLEPAMQAQLESLRMTVALLQMAERVPVPRNFTLDPAQYGTPEKVGLLARLGLGGVPRLVTAGAALLVVLMCVGVIVIGSRLVAGGTASVAEEPKLESAVEEPAEEAQAAAANQAQRAATDQQEEFAPEAPAADAIAEEEEPVEEAPPETFAMEEGAAVEAEAEEEAAPAEEVEAPAAEEPLPLPTQSPAGVGAGGGAGPTVEEAPSVGEADTHIPDTPLPLPTTVAEMPTEEEATTGEEEQSQVVDEAAATDKALNTQPAEQPPVEPTETAAASPVEPVFPGWAIGLMVAIGLLVILLIALSIVILARRRSS
jgi:hypothetical protein